ncbi:MAG: acyltransferase [Candidatus Moraniibacteriota bacterium]
MSKIRYLDGLRGLAAFEVIFHHFILAFYPALFSGPEILTHMKAGEEVYLSGSPLNLLYNGNFAVCIFFVLSGYVLSHKFFLHKDHEIITASAIKRYVRLAIPVAVSIFCVFILMKFSLFYNQQAAEISGSGWLGGFWTFRPDFLDALKQMFFGTFFSNIFDYNATLWTIAFEFMGSFLVFGFLAVFGKMKNRHLAYFFFAVVFFQTYYLAFILGMLLSDIMAHKNTIIRKFDKSKLLSLGLLILGLFLGSYPSGRDITGTMYAFMYNPLLSEPEIVYHVLGAFCVILVLLDSKKLQKFFSYKYFLFLGEISFAMYLLHFLILGSFSSFVFLKLVPLMSYAEAFGISFILSVALTFALSYLMSKYVDKRAVRFSHKLYERLFQRN